MSDEMTLTQAANEVRKLTRGLKAVDLIATAIDKVALLEQQEAALTTSIETKTSELAELKGTLQATKEEAKSALKDAKDEAVKIIDDAKATAKKATKTAADKVEAAEELLAATEKNYAEVLAKAQEDLADIENKRNEAQVALDALVQLTEDTKKNLSNFIGG